jgi:hypothetical protein
MPRRSLLALAIFALPGAPAARAQSGEGIGKVSFVLEETRGEHGRAPALRFVFQSTDLNQCQTLEAALLTQRDTIFLGPFTSRALPGPCPPTATPAIGTRAIALSNGRYLLHVVNGGSRDLYSVDITAALISVRPLRPTEGSSVGDSLVMRVQRNTFSFSCGALKEGEPFCAGAVRAIASLSRISEVHVPSGARGWQAQMSGYWYNEPTKYFRYVGASDLANAEKVMRKQYQAVGAQTGYALAVATWDGKDVYVSSRP